MRRGQAAATKGHGWREVMVEDPDGYVWAVGVPGPAPGGPEPDRSVAPGSGASSDLERRGGRWLATHTHVSLAPDRAAGSAEPGRR